MLFAWAALSFFAVSSAYTGDMFHEGEMYYSHHRNYTVAILAGSPCMKGCVDRGMVVECPPNCKVGRYPYSCTKSCSATGGSTNGRPNYNCVMGFC